MLVIVLVASRSGDAAKPNAPRCGGKPADQVVDSTRGVARSGPRGEAIAGTRRDDTLLGRGGDDRLCGRRGDDRIRAAGGRDRVWGGRGADRIKGGQGRDKLRGGKGNDRIKAAGRDRDKVSAGPGIDTVVSRDGVRDQVNCGPGFDIAQVDPEDDVAACDVANDGATPAFALPSWADGVFHTPDAYSTIQTGDMDGDGDDELIGRGPVGIEAYEFDTTKGQWMPLYPGGDPALADGGIWEEPQYYATIQLGDVNGDGADELLAREADGLHVWRFNPDAPANQPNWTELPKLADLSDADGWGLEPALYETIQTGNLLGGPEEEVFARETSGVRVWQLTGGQEWRQVVDLAGPLHPFDFADQPEYYTTIHSADMLGDGHEELWGRAPDGVRLYQLTDQGEWNLLDTMTHFSDQNGWGDPSAYTTLTTGKLTADGTTFVIGRDSDGIYAEALRLPWEGKPFESPEFNAQSGFGQPQYYSTFQTSDLDGDGVDEVLGRNKDGIWAFDVGDVKKVSLTPVKGDAAGRYTFSDADGWNNARYYDTIQTANIGSGIGRVLIGRGATGIQTAKLDLDAGSWASLSAQFPNFANNPDTQAAYAAIDEQLGGGNTKWLGLRQEYGASGTSLNTVDTWLGKVEDMQQPSNVPPDAWTEVKTQIVEELQNMDSAGGWFETEIDPQIRDSFVISQGTVQSVWAQSATTLDAGSADVTATLFAGIATIFEEAGEVTSVLGQEEDAAVLLMLGDALSAGLGSDGVNAADEAISATVVKIDGMLDANFQAALNGNTNAELAVFGDYGLQLAVEELIENKTWTAPLPPEAEAASQAAFTVWTWQQITPFIWGVYHDNSSRGSDYCDSRSSCYYVAGSAERHFDPRNETYYTPGDPVKTSVKTQLFSVVPPGDKCKTAWNPASCNLGVEKSDLFGGLSGWRIPRWECGASPGRAPVYQCQPGK